MQCVYCYCSTTTKPQNSNVPLFLNEVLSENWNEVRQVGLQRNVVLRTLKKHREETTFHQRQVIPGFTVTMREILTSDWSDGNRNLIGRGSGPNLTSGTLLEQKERH